MKVKSTLFQRRNEAAFSTLIRGYDYFTSSVSYEQYCLWCQPKLDVVTTLTI